MSRGPNANALAYVEHAMSDLGWVNMRAYNFFVSRPKVTNFLPNRDRPQ